MRAHRTTGTLTTSRVPSRGRPRGGALPGRLPGRLAGRLAAVLLAAALVTGCSSVQKSTGPDAGEAAGTLASALGSGDFKDVAFADPGSPATATKSYADTVAGMGGLTPTVTAGDVHTSGDKATATLSWRWPIGDQGWTYDTRAPLTRVGNAWQVAWDPSLVEPSLADGVVLDATPIAARRGAIVGAHGRALVTDRPVLRLGIDRSRVPAKRAGESARRLAVLLGIDAASYAKRVVAAGEKAFVEALVFRGDAVTPALLRGIQSIPGATAVAGELPLAPTKEFAAPILGTVGEVTAEMIKKDPGKYHLGDQAGLSGLQARYDDQLRGTPGEVVRAVASDGKERELFRVAPVPGTPLRITLDPGLQTTAEHLLSGVRPASALVAIRPSTGDLLVAANGPGTNGYNMATYGQFAPGSTFKSVSSLALLRAGLTPETPIPCTPTIDVNGKPFKNYSDYPPSGLGRIPLRTALANSCNTAFISQAGRLDHHGLVDAAGSLGLGIDHDLGFPAYFGHVEPPASETEAAADMIGQGKVLASPMAMATVIASIEAGKTVVPGLVKSVHVTPAGAAPLTGREAAQLRGMLRGVVTSGSGSLLLDVPGPPVIAKTGTAEFESHGRVLTHAWMIAAQGDLAVAVFVDIGESGSHTAGPILESFLRAARG